jgi:undecaprenyl diphosphate synthase
MPTGTQFTADSTIPRHVVIVMDGNGRWARQRNKPRAAGHQAGVTALRTAVEHSAVRGISILTVFAFSSENWRRPGREVQLLLELFMQSLQQEAERLHAHQVRLQFIGDCTRFPVELRRAIDEAERLTAANTGLRLVVAANYGGRWDITQAARRLATAALAGKLAVESIDEAAIRDKLCLGGLPEPDLFIRTAGEQRLSNFLLWQLAYTELYFTDCLWPDFSPVEMDTALEWYASRQRRFGRVTEQIQQASDA